MEFKNRLAELRKARNLSQADLAKALGISVGSVGMYESGKRTPDFERLEMFADFFNVDMNYLLGYADKSSYILDPKDMSLVSLLSSLTATERTEVEDYIKFIISRRK